MALNLHEHLSGDVDIESNCEEIMLIVAEYELGVRLADLASVHSHACGSRVLNMNCVIIFRLGNWKGEAYMCPHDHSG